MTLHVQTARVSYGGPDRLDVTAKSATGIGRAFAPSWNLLGPYLRKAKREGLTEEDMAGYVEGYTREMRHSYRTQRAAWNELLARERVTLVCYCTDGTRCHRRLLAQFLAACGAIDEGEVHA